MLEAGRWAQSEYTKYGCDVDSQHPFPRNPSLMVSGGCDSGICMSPLDEYVSGPKPDADEPSGGSIAIAIGKVCSLYEGIDLSS